jgi:hypothetical protein
LVVDRSAGVLGFAKGIGKGGSAGGSSCAQAKAPPSPNPASKHPNLKLLHPTSNNSPAIIFTPPNSTQRFPH